MAQDDPNLIVPVGQDPDITDESTQADLAALRVLEAYATSIGVKNSLDDDPIVPVLTLQLKNGRDFRSVYIANAQSALALSGMPLDRYSFLGQYSAVVCYEQGWMEAALSNLDSSVSRQLLKRRIFGPVPLNEPQSLFVDNGGPVRLELTESAQFLGHVYGTNRLFLRITGIAVMHHDAALNLLVDISNSLFMQLDLKIEVPLALGRDRLFPRRRKGVSENLRDQVVSLPRYSYDDKAAALYWYGRSARSLPLLQFLAFYQAIEVFFPHYSRIETVGRVRNFLKNPAFDGSKDADINGLLNLASGVPGFGVSERLQLRSVVDACVTADELRQFLTEDTDRKAFFDGSFKDVSKVRISLREDADIINQAVERIYDIRCKVVHTKNSDTGLGPEVILPYSREAELLHDDIDLLRFIARKVLIASGRLLEIKAMESPVVEEEKLSS
jgi:hypothetical protein